MIPMNMPYAKADLASHILQMCPHVWQDQYNLHEKGGTPMDMCLLLLSLEAIEHICNQGRYNASPNKKAAYSEKKGSKRPGTDTTARPKKAHTEKHFDLYKKHGGAYRMQNTRECRQFKKDRTINLISAPPRKAERKSIPLRGFCAVEQEIGPD